ncbi:MAG: hypothetical protein JXA95_16150 [Spirochaetales bacterium]|nr:hypothetical protein [Spirochaetales bacterium]
MGRHTFRRRILPAFTGTLLINTLFLISYIRLSGEKFLYAQKEESVQTLVAVLEKSIITDLISSDFSRMKEVLDPILIPGSSIEVYRIFDSDGSPVAYGKADGANDFMKKTVRMDITAAPSWISHDR